VSVKKNINFKQNLKNKKLLIENLKNLILIDERINIKYKKFKKIQKKWFELGPVHRVDNLMLWNNYQHHVKNFYDYLHLNRKFKEIDFERNLVEKKKIISFGKDLIKYEDKIKAYKYFKKLKIKWEYEIGPTKKEDEIYINKEFLKIEKNIYESRKNYDQNKDSILESNLLKKQAYLDELEKIVSNDVNNSKDWKKKIKEFEELKKKLESTGPILSDQKKAYWDNFKRITKIYYSSKNIFFKNLKKKYRENIKKQELLIKKTENLKFEESFDKIKKEIILTQKNWKEIKPVPYKINEENWKKLKSLHDLLFKKFEEKKKNQISKLKSSEREQNKFLKNIRNNISKLDIKEILTKWEKLGFKNKEIETQFENILIKILKHSGLNIEDSNNKLFELRVSLMDTNKKNNELINLNKEKDLLIKEISILENNLSFFNKKSRESKLLNKVHEDIKVHKKRIENIIYQKKILKG